MKNSLELIMKLKPATYQFKTEEYKRMQLPKGEQIGLIADELKEVFPELVKKAVQPAEYDKTDRKKVINPKVEYEAVNYQGLIPVLIASTQEQQQQIEELKKENAEIKQQLAELKAMIGGKGNAATINISGAYLEQSLPNPAGSSTVIRYGIPDGNLSAKITVTNMNGQLLKTISINGRGAGQVSLDTAALPAGVYNYTLWLDGRQEATKQMIIRK